MNDNALQTQTAQSTAEVATPNASRYLQQLCKHFAHKRPVTFDPQSGHITLSAGDCALSADEGVLRLSLTASDPSQLEQLKDVVARHLLRFSFREDIQIDWRPA